jgi:hypothetical protein
MCAFSPRARRTSPEEAFNPRVRRNSPVGAFSPRASEGRPRGHSAVPPWRAAGATRVVIVSCTCFRFMS